MSSDIFRNKEANFIRDVFEFNTFPKVKLENIEDSPKKFATYLTDTTFRDGQQSLKSYSKQDVLTMFKMLSKIDNGCGVIRNTEMFPYTDFDRDIIRECVALNLKFPKITTWIRAKNEDLELVRNLEILETGILMPVSDFHIYKKMKSTRLEASKQYQEVLSNCFDFGIIPRLHFEDVTRSDIYGYVLPLIKSFNQIAKGRQYKIRLCDTLGLGVAIENVQVPRGVPKLIKAIKSVIDGFNVELEWHGHNDFGVAVTNSLSAWMSGVNSINCTLFGIGERNGNTPIELMLAWYKQLIDTSTDINFNVLQNLKLYFENELEVKISSQTPLVGDSTFVTKSGIHINALLKDMETYFSYDVQTVLGKESDIRINRFSGRTILRKLISENNEDLQDLEDIVEKTQSWIQLSFEKGRKRDYSIDEIIEYVNKSVRCTK